MAEDDEDMRRALSASYRRIFDVVLRIPRGKVMTYGEVAEAAGMRGGARIVGYAMHALGKKLPWQRVLGKRRDGIAHVTIKDALGGATQRTLLEKEGVRFSDTGGVDLSRFGHAKRGKKR
jgi:methylated-DNA-protein-cysteine methyltransferase-like protein